MTIGKKIMKIEKILIPKTKVYDFEVEDAHHYIFGDGTVSHNSYVPTKRQGGGSGLDYAASTVAFLSKKKNRDADKNITGAIITVVLDKARLSVENKRVEVLLNYETGLDKYYGLVDIAVELGVFKKVSTQIVLPDGSKAFEVAILRNPEKYFTKEVLDAIDALCPAEFLYGKSVKTELETTEVSE